VVVVAAASLRFCASSHALQQLVTHNIKMVLPDNDQLDEEMDIGLAEETDEGRGTGINKFS
jgi:hypothetical protein